MRIANKLALSFVGATSIVFAAYGYRNVHREAAAIEAERADGARLLGRQLVLALERLSHHSSRAELESFCAQASDPTRGVEIQFLAADAVGPIATLVAEADTRILLPVAGGAAPAGFVALTRSRATVDAEFRDATSDWLGALVVAAALKGVLAVVLGGLIVGRPIQSLVDHARRVGVGDLATRLSAGPSDELGALVQEMNAMSERLLAARTRITAETQARLETLEQLRHADRLSTIGRLAAGVAHEMGTPLNVIGGRAKLIATREVEGDDAVASARIVVEQTDRLTRIVRQLLDFSRRRPLERSRIDLGGLATRVLELLRPIAQKRQVELRCEPAAEAAEVDAAQVEQALTNLVLNGVQAQPDGGVVTVHVGRVTLKPPPDVGGDARPWVQLSVVDRGVGMAPDDIARVFEPFFTTKQVGEGTGLGLSVAYGIVREHGGWIDVKSARGEGSTFSVLLPPAAGA